MAVGSASKSRRSKGEGSLVQRKDGRWMGRYTVVLDDGTKKRQSIILKDRAAVLEKMRMEMRLADKGSPVLHSKGTTGDYLAYWLKLIDPMQVRPTTLQTHTSIVNSHLIPQLGNIPLTQLKPDHVRRMLAHMKQRGCGGRSMQMTRNVLSAALRDAVKEEILHRNVAILVPAPEYTPSERKHWTKEQVMLFFETAKTHQHYLVFLLLLSYGLRRGEVLGLRWKDIDFENNIIKVRQALKLINYKAIIGPLKTRASKRDLPILPFIKEALIAHFDASEMHADGLVFHASTGNPIYPNVIAKIFKKQALKAGLPPISIHEARHTTATLLAQAWANPKEAQSILGHSSVATTLGLYTHTNYENTASAMAALTAGFSI